ncbi:cache domain-containing sensor histidine kinase [Neobacillus vireti]|uniref:histidine kinase n=1 Tax=Neobacillus vireti LMG 21834 TaxID=1131730 RepID=A0AB94ISY7_9BACI|nr:sensor histidine kinase [Neobacillus vireti]ETI70156.1 sensor protein with HAMP domain [Neobacillus vireti LMG 21834]
MSKHFMNLSLQKKLMIFFTIIVMIPMILLGNFMYQKTSEIVTVQVSERVLERLIQINKNLTFFTKDIEQVSNYIYRNDAVQGVLMKPSVRSDFEKYEDFNEVTSLFEMVRGSKNWRLNLYIIGLNGDRYFTGEYLPPQYDQYLENWGIFRKASAAKGALVWDTHYTIRKVDNQDIVLSASRLLKNTKTGEPIGYLLIDVPESTIADIYQQKKADTSQLFLLDKDGYVISGSPSKTTIGMKLEHPVLDNILNSQRGYLRKSWNGQPAIVTYDTSEDAHYKIATFIPEKEVTKRNILIGYITLILVIISFIVAIWLSYFFSKTLTNPIQRLNRLIKKVEKGNLEVSYQPRYKDEIGSLGQSFNNMILQLKKLINESIEKQTLLQEAEIKTLRAQINPHFLYNTLETISAIAKLKDVKVVSEMSIALGEMMRYSIHKEKQFVKLEEDLRLLNHYLFIQMVRFQDKFTVAIHVEEPAKELYLPPLLIQPIIENAINHGLEMKLGEGELIIDIFIEQDFLVIKVKDDGLGMDEATLANICNLTHDTKDANHTGIGMENVIRRIELFFGSKYGVLIESKIDCGTTVTIRLPVIRERGEHF